MTAADALLAVVRDHVEAFNGKDLERVVAGFGDDAVFATGDHLVVGRRGIRGLFAEALGELDATLEVRTAVAQGELVACEMTERLLLQGQQFTFHLAAFYTVRDGVIARAKIYREGSAEPPSA